MGKKNRFTGVRNFFIIMVVFVLILFAADRLVPVFSVQIDSDYYDATVDFLRVEKTPVESFLTVKEATDLCQLHEFDITGCKINEYPLIADMPSSVAVDDNTVKIVVIGDSFVWGDNSLNRNELFWRQTEQMLRSKGYNCSVTAIAMAGATAYEEIKWYENYLKYNTPDLVVFGYVFNDPQVNDADDSEKEDVEVSEFLPVLKPVEILLPNIYSGITSYIETKTLYSDKYDDKREESLSAILKGETREYYQKYFVDKLDAITNQTNIPSVVMTLPVIPGSNIFKALFEPLPEIYEGTSVKFYDCYEEFDEFYSLKHKKNVFVNPGNNHPGSAVHYFYASYLTDLLEKDFGEVLGEKSDESLLSRVININECTPSQIDLETVYLSEEQASYTFSYPVRKTHTYLFLTVEQYWLTYPLDKGYIKLSFETPVDISGVELSGAPDNTEIYYSRVNEKLGYDDNTLYPVLLDYNGDVITGTVNDMKVTSLCIHIDEDKVTQEKIGLKIIS